MKKIIIVGSDVGGFFSALLLQKQGLQTCLVETAPSLGGPYDSWTSPEGYSFDQSFQIPKRTGVVEIDRHLFARPSHFQEIRRLRSGNYMFGQLNSLCPDVDSRLLPWHLYREAMEGLCQSALQPTRSQLVEYLKEEFGLGFAENVLKPAYQKIFGLDVHELSSQVAQAFELNRIMVENPKRSHSLRKNSAFARKISSHHFSEHPSEEAYWYSPEFGNRAWISSLTHDLLNHGGLIITEAQIESVLTEKDQIYGLKMRSGQIVKTDHLIWSRPLAHFSLLLQKGQKILLPRRRHSLVFHLVFNKPFKTELQQVTNYDSRFSTFRVWLYPNLEERPKVAPYRCSVEVLADNTVSGLHEMGRIIDELKAMGLVVEDAKALSAYQAIHNFSYPILTPGFLEAAQKQRNEFEQTYKNVSFLGAATLEAFDLKAKALEAYDQISRLDLLGADTKESAFAQPALSRPASSANSSDGAS